MAGRTYALAAYVASVAGLTKDEDQTYFPRCGRALCCNPDHAGTVKRFSRISHRPVYRKLKREQVLAIYQAKDGDAPIMARQYGVHPTSIRNIWRGVTYATLTGQKREGMSDEQ